VVILLTLRQGPLGQMEASDQRTPAVWSSTGVRSEEIGAVVASDHRITKVRLGIRGEAVLVESHQADRAASPVPRHPGRPARSLS
jgi:hypothetical protein